MSVRLKQIRAHAPKTFVGQARDGAAQTLLEQRPYTQFVPAVQAAPTARPVLGSRDEVVTL